MTTSANDSHGYGRNFSWESLYYSLRPRINSLIYSLDVSLWSGQEYDTADDLVQEAVIRIWEYSLRAARGEARPMDSPIAMAMTIARNHSIDTSRRDRRYVRIGQNSRSPEISLPAIKYHQADPSEDVIERVFEESLLLMLPSEIAKFPVKLRRALLIDLANRMNFAECPTPLQQAFMNVGIRLQEYQQPLPNDLVERRRHASLLSIAYKRIANLACLQQYKAA